MKNDSDDLLHNLNILWFYRGDITPEVKRKNLSSKETQASIENKITVEDLTNPKGASEKYWEILAGKRQ